jgi:hypothetical protein
VAEAGGALRANGSLEIEPHGQDLRRDRLEVRKATLASVLRKSDPGCGLFLWLNELATRPHFAKYAVRGKVVDVAKLANRGRIDGRITD